MMYFIRTASQSSFGMTKRFLFEVERGGKLTQAPQTIGRDTCGIYRRIPHSMGAAQKAQPKQNSEWGSNHVAFR